MYVGRMYSGAGTPNISSDSIGYRSTVRRMFRRTACKPLIGWPSTVSTRIPIARLPGVWPFMYVSKKPP